jgi:stringent starvation protein B
VTIERASLKEDDPAFGAHPAARNTAVNLPSTKPYLLRAIHQWCCDNGFTPYISVAVDARTKVPREFVRDGQIVLNIGLEATGHLQLANDVIAFQARFGGVARDIAIPVGNVTAIYAKENGAGMAFDAEPPSEEAPASEGEPEPPQPSTPRPKLQRIK